MCNFTQWQYGMASVDFRWNVSGSFMQVIPRFVSVDETGNEYEFLADYFEDIHEAYSYVFLKGYQWPFSYGRAKESSQIDFAVHSETSKGRKVYLDYRKNPDGFCFEKLSAAAKDYINSTDCMADTPFERLSKLNSKAIDVYLRQEINLEKDMLRIAVCAQHNNGGVYTDSNFESDIKGLYVIGEAAGTFGLSRPGGSALNDTQVGGLVCARHISGKTDTTTDESIYDAFTNDEADFTADDSISYAHLKNKMSRVASFKRDYEGCVKLLGEITDTLAAYPKKHKSLYDYYRDKDMLLSMKALLEAIVSELPETGSRGGAVFIKNSKVTEENPYYRDYLTVTKDGKAEYIRVSPVPYGQKPFEHYLSEIDENEM